MAKGAAWAAPAVLATAAIPAYAASQGNQYRFRGSIYSGFNHSDYYCSQTTATYTRLWLSNQVPVGDSPLGFTVTQMPNVNNPGRLSDPTVANLPGPVHFLVAYPAGLINTDSRSNGFNFSDATQTNWTAPAVTTNVRLTPQGANASGLYDIFVFGWKGLTSQTTVPNVNTSNGRPASWEGTALVGSWDINYNKCMSTAGFYAFANYYTGGTASRRGENEPNLGIFTTNNGFTGNIRSIAPNNNGWFTVRRS